MKLLFCRGCGDVFNLGYKMKTCSCGKTYGKYIDNLNAIYSTNEEAVPVGFSNPDFVHAIKNQPDKDYYGKRFEAFVIPKQCPTFVKKEIIEFKEIIDM